jgi:hypothetical protein
MELLRFQKGAELVVIVRSHKFVLPVSLSQLGAAEQLGYLIQIPQHPRHQGPPRSSTRKMFPNRRASSSAT